MKPLVNRTDVRRWTLFTDGASMTTADPADIVRVAPKWAANGGTWFIATTDPGEEFVRPAGLDAARAAKWTAYRRRSR